MTTALDHARRHADGDAQEFAAALLVIKRAGRSHERALKLAEVVESFMGDLDGLHGLLAVEDAAANLRFTLDNCFAPPEQISVYRRQA